MKWIEFKRQGILPPERRHVLVQVAARESDLTKKLRELDGDRTPFLNLPVTVAVGYLRVHSDGPFWVVPGVGGPVTHWCDCLGDDFCAPGWQSKQIKGEHKRIWWRDEKQRHAAL